MGRELLENGAEGRGLMGHMGEGTWERGKHLECKQRINSPIKNDEFMKFLGK